MKSHCNGMGALPMSLPLFLPPCLLGLDSASTFLWVPSAGLTLPSADKRRIDVLLGKWTHGEARTDLMSGETGRRIDAAERCLIRAQRAAAPYMDAARDKASECIHMIENAADEFVKKGEVGHARVASRHDDDGETRPGGTGGMDIMKVPKAALNAAVDGLRSVVRAAVGYDGADALGGGMARPFHRIVDAEAGGAHSCHLGSEFGSEQAAPARSPHFQRYAGRLSGEVPDEDALASVYPLSYRGWAYKTRSFSGSCRAHVAKPTLRRFLEYHAEPQKGVYELRIFHYAEHADLFPAKLPGRVLDLVNYVIVCDDDDYQAERLGLEHRSPRGDSWWIKCPEANSFRRLHNLLTTITDQLSAQHDERMWDAQLDELNRHVMSHHDAPRRLEEGLLHSTPRSEGGASTESGSRSAGTTPRRLR